MMLIISTAAHMPVFFYKTGYTDSEFDCFHISVGLQFCSKTISFHFSPQNVPTINKFPIAPLKSH